MKLFFLIFCFLQACSNQIDASVSKITNAQFNSLKFLLNNQAQCRTLKNGLVNWPIRNPTSQKKSNIDCKKMFERLEGQTLYFYTDHDEDDPQGSILLKSNFFKYPEATDCFDERENIIDCPGLDIAKVVFSKNKNEDSSLLAMILHQNQKLNTASVKLVNNEKICQINFSIHSKTQTYKTETYNILALYGGRQNKNNAPLCDEESLAMSPIFQDSEAKNLCKEKVERDFKEALERIDPIDHDRLKNRANKLKQDCDKATLNQLRTNFFLTPEL